MFPAADLFEDIGSFGGPDEGLGMVVVFGEVAVDGDLQVGHTPEDAASDALAGDLGEEAFDEIQPRRRGGREMQTEPGMLREPPLHVRMLVGGVVVDHQMQIEIRRGPLVDHGQKPDEFLVTMTGRAVADDRAVQHVEGGEQSGSAVPLVVVRHRARSALLQRQPRLGAVERLNLAHMGICGSRVPCQELITGLRWLLRIQGLSPFA